MMYGSKIIVDKTSGEARPSKCRYVTDNHGTDWTHLLDPFKIAIEIEMANRSRRKSSRSGDISWLLSIRRAQGGHTRHELTLRYRSLPSSVLVLSQHSWHSLFFPLCAPFIFTIMMASLVSLFFSSFSCVIVRVRKCTRVFYSAPYGNYGERLLIL